MQALPSQIRDHLATTLATAGAAKNALLVMAALLILDMAVMRAAIDRFQRARLILD